MATRTGAGWQSVLMDIDLTAQYSGEDIDRTSALVNLGAEYTGVMIFVPAIDSAAVSLLVQRNSAIATVPVGLHYKLPSDASTALWATTAGTGGCMIHCPCLGGIQYFRIYTGTNQTADRTFYVKGTV